MSLATEPPYWATVSIDPTLAASSDDVVRASVCIPQRFVGYKSEVREDRYKGCFVLTLSRDGGQIVQYIHASTLAGCRTVDDSRQHLAEVWGWMKRELDRRLTPVPFSSPQPPSLETNREVAQRIARGWSRATRGTSNDAFDHERFEHARLEQARRNLGTLARREPVIPQSPPKPKITLAASSGPRYFHIE